MQSVIKKILCPIDFSDSSINAMEYAAKLSKELNCSLTLWNIYELTILDEMASKNIRLETNDSKQNELSEILQDWCEEIKEEYAIPCGYLVGSGAYSLEETLAQYTDGENFDLIIAGTNGIDNMYQFFFGTSSYRIIKETKCPVMIIPKEYSFKEMKSVFFATDYTATDATFAKRLVETINSTITSFNTEAFPKGGEVPNLIENVLEESSKTNQSVHFEQFNHLIELDDLLQKLIQKNADLVIISAKYSSWFEELFRKSIHKKATEGIRVPVLVFHKIEEEIGDSLIH